MQEASVIFSKSFSLLFSKEYLAQNLGKLDKQYSPGGKEMFTGFVRTVILYLVLIVGIRLMGKRQVGSWNPRSWCCPWSSLTWLRYPCRISAFPFWPE